MKSLLIHKVHKLGFYYYSVKYFAQDHKKDYGAIRSKISALKSCAPIFKKHSGYYEYLEIPITTRCSLACKKCSNLIPYYTNPKDIDSKILLQSIDTFLDCIENIVYIRLLGGEPFLCENLPTVLNKLIDSNKVQRIEIVTNGTITPQNKALPVLLQNPKVIVCISQYSQVKNNPLISFLKQQNIHYRIDHMNYWFDYGDIQKTDKTISQLKKQFQSCHHICNSLLNGNLHLCPRSSHATDLKIIQNNTSDYVNLLDETSTIQEKKELIEKLQQKEYINACYYCNYATSKCKKIPVAEQIKR